jgi:hypothetical protein
MLKRKAWIVAATLALIAVGLFGWRQVGYRVSRSGVYWIPPPNRSTVESRGLRLTINSVQPDAEGVLIVFTIQDLENSPKYRLGGIGTPITVDWWDVNGEGVGKESFEVVSHEFDSGSRESLTCTVVFAPPRGAVSVSVGCGKRMTNKVRLPPP